jgi:adenosyl cobinamide kinase/adenosyl cobinamide phosphate guanylyltransferase
VFRDTLGTVNRLIADCADSVLLVVAGRVLPLGRPGDDR